VRKHQLYQHCDSEDTKSQFLWITGDPGCGKTVLSKFLLQGIENRHDASVAYFFFDEKYDNQNSADSCLRALLHQLIELDPKGITHAMKFFDSQAKKMVESLDTLWQILSAILGDQKEDTESIYLVIDDLDECEEKSRNYLLKRFDENLQAYT
jgi:predicted AAA+ superfamily ATPase